MMVNPECHWVIARLPLGAGQLGEPSDHSGTRGDLAFDELQAIRRHLTGCAACRDYKASILRATQVLAVAALNPPTLPNSRSLWLDLEQRIAERNALDPVSSSVTRSVHGATFARIQETIRGWTAFWSEERWYGAWLGDEARAFFDFSIDRLRFAPRPRLGVIVASGLAAVVIVFRVGLPALHEREVAANAVIAANKTPSPEWTTSTWPTSVDTAEHTSSPAESEGSPDRQLAQVESSPARESETPSPIATRVDSAPVAKAPAPPTRFNFDLDHGTPMPPDSRDPKPVY